MAAPASTRRAMLARARRDLANLQKMLDELRDVPAERRTARYQCVIAFAPSA